jgi:hypothetical protein
MLAFTLPIAVLLAVAIRPRGNRFGFGPAETKWWYEYNFLCWDFQSYWLEGWPSFYPSDARTSLKRSSIAYIPGLGFSNFWVSGIAWRTLPFTSQAVFTLHPQSYFRVLQVRTPWCIRCALGDVLALILLLWTLLFSEPGSPLKHRCSAMDLA